GVAVDLAGDLAAVVLARRAGEEDLAGARQLVAGQRLLLLDRLLAVEQGRHVRLARGVEHRLPVVPSQLQLLDDPADLLLLEVHPVGEARLGAPRPEQVRGRPRGGRGQSCAGAEGGEDEGGEAGHADRSLMLWSDEVSGGAGTPWR